MQLKTTMVDGRIAGCPVADLEHDAACAHALNQAKKEYLVRNHDGRVIGSLVSIEVRADELLRDWAAQLTETGNG